MTSSAILGYAFLNMANNMIILCLRSYTSFLAGKIYLPSGYKIEGSNNTTLSSYFGYQNFGVDVMDNGFSIFVHGSDSSITGSVRAKIIKTF